MAIMRVKKINLTDQVYSQLKRSLLTGEWTEGTRIPSENTLCKEFSVSRVVVREALQMLRAEKLIVTRHGMGTFAANPGNFLPTNQVFNLSEESYRNFLDFRNAVEIAAVKLGSKRATEADYRRMEECLQAALSMKKKNAKVFVPQQFENINNTLAHKKHTALEIMAQVAKPIHGFCSGIGTGGTLTGIGEVLKAQYPDLEIWAVEPENAAILAGGTIGTHLQMGIGDGIIPDILNREIYDDIYVVTDQEAIETARRLAREEGLACGISSGTNVAAAIRLAEKLGPGKTVVTVLPDTAERY